MKVTAITTVYVGKGAKAKALEPGTGFDTKKVGLDDEEALGLIAAGHLAAAGPQAVAAVEETKPNESTDAGVPAGGDSEDSSAGEETLVSAP